MNNTEKGTKLLKLLKHSEPIIKELKEFFLDLLSEVDISVSVETKGIFARKTLSELMFLLDDADTFIKKHFILEAERHKRDQRTNRLKTKNEIQEGIDDMNALDPIVLERKRDETRALMKNAKNPTDYMIKLMKERCVRQGISYEEPREQAEQTTKPMVDEPIVTPMVDQSTVKSSSFEVKGGKKYQENLKAMLANPYAQRAQNDLVKKMKDGTRTGGTLTEHNNEMDLSLGDPSNFGSATVPSEIDNSEQPESL